MNYTGSGGQGKTWAKGDFTGDGTVSGDDFVALAVNYTGSLGAAGSAAWSVPEPASAVLVVLGAMACGRLLRRRGRFAPGFVTHSAPWPAEAAFDSPSGAV